MFVRLILVRISRISSCCMNLDGRPMHKQRIIIPPSELRQPTKQVLYSEPTDYAGTKKVGLHFYILHEIGASRRSWV